MSRNKPKPGDDCNRTEPADCSGNHCTIKIELENKGTVNIFNCPPFGTVPPPTPEPMPDACPQLPPEGACVPLAIGHKPKQSREAKLARILANDPVPNVLSAAFFHMARRFLMGRAPANPIEQRAFAVLAGLSPQLQQVLRCAVLTFESLPPSTRDRLFPAELLDTDEAVSPSRLTELLGRELQDRVGIEVFGHAECLEVERPGLARPGPGIESNETFFVPTICRINGLRTRSHVPSLSLGEYRPEELQQVCVPEVVDGEVRVECETLTSDCPGNEVEGTCLRVQEVRPGEAVILEGFNYYNVDGRVRLRAKAPGTVTREVEAHVCGDVETPLTETVDGDERTILDCRVHDRLSFRVPDDLPPGIYSITVIMPNNTGIGPITEFQSFGEEFITVVPPPTATFQIASERLDAIEETSPASFGSDEVAIRVLAVPISPDFTPGEMVESNFRFGDVDSGEQRTMARTLFREAGIGGVSLAILGFEVDDEDAFTKQIQEFSDAYVEIMKSTWQAVIGGLAGVGGGLALALGLSAAWAAAIAAAITLAVTIFVALWAPADLIIEDAASFTALDLGTRTSVNFPSPPVLEYTSGGGIEVSVEPVSKSGSQYVERRSYRSDEEDSRYRITLRYNQS